MAMASCTRRDSNTESRKLPAVSGIVIYGRALDGHDLECDIVRTSFEALSANRRSGNNFFSIDECPSISLLGNLLYNKSSNLGSSISSFKTNLWRPT